MLLKRTATFPKAWNCTADVPTWLSSIFCFFVKKGQIGPNMGKHRVKQELESVPTQESGTVPPKKGKKCPLRWYSF